MRMQNDHSFTQGDLLNIAQVCQKLHVSRNTVYRLIEKGLLNAIRIEHSLRFREADVDAFIESRQTAARRRKPRKGP